MKKIIFIISMLFFLNSFSQQSMTMFFNDSLPVVQNEHIEILVFNGETNVKLKDIGGVYSGNIYTILNFTDNNALMIEDSDIFHTADGNIIVLFPNDVVAFWYYDGEFHEIYRRN